METTENKEVKKKILIIEDDIFISDIYQMKVEMDGMEALIAMNGMEAMKMLEEGTMPDLIMLDIVMPYMDGMGVLKRLKADDTWKKIPVILLSNLSEKSQIGDCMELGANDYLIKSHFTPSEVMQKVVSLLNV